MQNLIPVLLVAIATSTLLNVLLKRLNLPTVIGYIVTGAIIGNVLDIYVEGNKPLENIAELGIVFLMFTL
jgi:CPA2 family monovalent cation:H+ antiporter-2